MSPAGYVPGAFFNNTSVAVIPIKSVVADVLYPHVLVVRALAVTFVDAGILDPTIVIAVEPTARMYNLYPVASVENTVTAPFAVPSVPVTEGLTDRFTALVALMDKEVSPP